MLPWRWRLDAAQRKTLNPVRQEPCRCTWSFFGRLRLAARKISRSPPVHGLQHCPPFPKARVFGQGLCRVPEESFDFLGYTIGRNYSKRTGRAYLGTRPARKRVQRICEEVSQATQRSTLGQATEEIVSGLNCKLRGWSNYFCLGAVSSAYRAVDSHTRHRLRQWLCKKHKTAGAGTGAYPDEYLYEKLGLLRLAKLTANLPWAKA